MWYGSAHFVDSTLVLYTLCIVIQLCLFWRFYTTLFILGIFFHNFWILGWLFYVVDFDTAFHFEILTQLLNFVNFDTGFFKFFGGFWPGGITVVWEKVKLQHLATQTCRLVADTLYHWSSETNNRKVEMLFLIIEGYL